MKPKKISLRGNVLPTVTVVSVVMLTAMLGLFMLWEQEAMFSARNHRLRQARADTESAFALWRMYPYDEALTSAEGYQLYDSLKQSRVFIRTEPWGLYETVRVRTADSVADVCRMFGVEHKAENTLYYADNRSALTLAGHTILQGRLHLPQNGLGYGRIGSNFYSGAEIPRTAILRSGSRLPRPEPEAIRRIAALFANARELPLSAHLPDSLIVSFRLDSAIVFSHDDAVVDHCSLKGRIMILGNILYFDSTCRLEHALVVARKVIVGSGARITGQFIARDTLIVEPGAVLEYPSGIYAGVYAELGEKVVVNGYAIVRDTAFRKNISVNYHQSRTARLRGLLWVDGEAQVQGIVSGQACLKHAVFFSHEGLFGYFT